MSTPRKERPDSSRGGNSSTDDRGSSVQVVVRCRPPSEKEKASGDPLVVGVYPQHNEVRVLAKKGPGAGSAASSGSMAPPPSKLDSKTYTFDQTYGALSTQEEVYNQAVKPLVEEVLNGFNCTVFAYGQTGTGKTHTMEGEVSTSVTPNSGVIPRAVHTIFDQLAEKKYEDFSVKVSFLELYNEELSDLLCEYEERPPSSLGGGSSKSDDSERKELRIFEDSTGKKGMMVHGLEEVLVASAPQVFGLLAKANKNRKVAATDMNKNSSRSHYVFTITVHTKEYNEDGEDIIKTGKLYLVDLAGSECIGKSGAKEKRAFEAGRINQSLLTLGRVINALVDRASFIPYRDSKLTRLLQESLGGRAKTVMIANISPSASAFDETLSTLDYAHRAKSIKNKPQKTLTMTKRAYMKELLAEIASLKRDNEVLRSKNGIIIPPEKWERFQAEEKGKSMQIDELLFKIKGQEEKLEKLENTLCEKEALLSQTLSERDALTLTLSQTVELLDSTRATLATTQDHLLASQKLLITFQRMLHEREVQLEDTQAIVAAHKQTEGQLTAQAQQVIGVLEHALTDKEQLHAKIDRKAEVEAHNTAAAHSFHARLQEEVQQMQEQEESMQQEAGKQIQHIHAAIEETATTRQQQLSALSDTQQSFDGSIRQQTSQTAAHLSLFQQQHAALLSTHQSASDAFHAEQSTQLTEVQKQGNHAFQHISQETNNLQKMSEAQFARTQQAATAAQEATAAFVSQKMKPGLEQLAEQASQHSSQAISASHAASSFLTSFSAAQSQLVSAHSSALHARIGEMQQELMSSLLKMQSAFMSEVSSLIEQHKQEQMEALQQNMQQASKQVEDMAAKERENQERIQQDTQRIQQQGEQFVQEQQAQLDSSSAQAIEAQEQLLRHHTALAQHTQQAQSQQHSLLDSALSAHSARRETAASECEAVREQVATFSAEQAAALQAAQETSIAHTSAVSQWVSLAQESDAAASQQLRDGLNGVSATLQTHADSCAHSLPHLTDTVDSYVHSELRADVPLGCTPQKGSAPAYPKQAQLAKTASPTTLVQAYRQEHPVQALRFQGLLPLEGIEEMISSEEQANQQLADRAPTPLSEAEAETASASDSSSPSSPAASVAAVPALDMCASECEDDQENSLPSPSNLSLHSSSPPLEKAAPAAAAPSKRPTHKTTLSSSKIAVPAAARPMTRLRYGTMPANSFSSQ